MAEIRNLPYTETGRANYDHIFAKKTKCTCGLKLCPACKKIEPAEAPGEDPTTEPNGEEKPPTDNPAQ